MTVMMRVHCVREKQHICTKNGVHLLWISWGDDKLQAVKWSPTALHFCHDCVWVTATACLWLLHLDDVDRPKARTVTPLKGSPFFVTNHFFWDQVFKRVKSHGHKLCPFERTSKLDVLPVIRPLLIQPLCCWRLYPCASMCFIDLSVFLIMFCNHLFDFEDWLEQ